MKSDLISIIIPALNEAKNIEKCLKSCQKQSYKNIEIVVIDNFSTDNTYQIAKKYTKNCFQKGDERSKQRNFGAKKAKGKYLLFLDADMQLTKNCLTDAINTLKDKNTVIAFPEISIGQNFWEKSISLERNLYQKEKVLQGARFFPKSLFLKLNGYDPNLIAGEDWDITIRAQKANNVKLIISKSPIVHTENIPNLSRFIKKKAYYSKNIHLYAKKHPHQFKLQSSFKIRVGIYLKNWRLLATHLHHTIGFLFLKALIWFDWSLKKT